MVLAAKVRDDLDIRNLIVRRFDHLPNNGHFFLLL
jgi:hypothetical protein